MAAERWTTFDCYGTLIDWNLGIGRELEQLFGVGAAHHLLVRYHEVERDIESEPFHT
jgi:FMN phosphatase YigB (HAD superfamily)